MHHLFCAHFFFLIFTGVELRHFSIINAKGMPSLCNLKLQNRAFFHHFGTMTHTPGIGNFSAKMPKIGNFLVLLAILSNHKIHHIFI